MSATLVLNATYEPLCVVALRRAVVLVLTGKAVTVESDGIMRASSMSVETPQVIRLSRYVRVPYRRQIGYSKKAVLARDSHLCAYCGSKATTVDHVVPKVRGGQSTFDNTVAACQKCNHKKDQRTLADLGWSLPFTPAAPAGLDAFVVGLLGTQPITPSWEQYLNGNGSEYAPAHSKAAVTPAM